MKHGILGMYAAAIIAVGLVSTSPSRAQSEAERNRLAFEVASVKPSQPGGRGGGIKPMPGGQTYVATNIPLRLMMMSTYRISDIQIVGAPSWMDTELWDVDAKAEHPVQPRVGCQTINILYRLIPKRKADRSSTPFAEHSVFCRPLCVVDDEEFGGPLGWFEFQPELL